MGNGTTKHSATADDQLDQKRILTVAKLRLSRHIKQGESKDDFLVVKNVPRKTYLLLDRDQWSILSRFSEPTTLEHLLPLLILDRACPPLASLYELILKAYSADILIESDEPEDLGKAFNWRLSMNQEFCQMVGVGFILFGFLSLLRNDVEIPSSAGQIAAGLVAMSLGIGLGYVLAGCVIRGFDCEVYSPRLHWGTLIPHFRIDIDDAKMGGRNCEICVALMRLSPMFLVAGLVSFWYAALEFVIVVGIFWIVSPFGYGPVPQMLSALYRNARLSTSHDFLFVQNRMLWTFLNSKFRFFDRNYYLIYGVYTLLWLATIFFTNCSIFNINAVALLTDIISQKGWQMVNFVVLLTTCLLILGSGSLGLWILFKNLGRLVHGILVSRFRPKAGKASTSDSRENITEVLSQSILFKESQRETIEKIAEVIRIVDMKARRFVIYEGETGDRLFILAAGRVEVLKELPSGRPEKIAELREGDIFGEIALLQNMPRTRSIRTLRACRFYTLSQDDFEKLVLASLGTSKIREILHKRAFLARTSLCQNWHPQAIQRFAAMSVLNTVKPDEIIVHNGHNNYFFYIIYEGSFDVLRDGKRLASLRTGDFFGEISLLQNSISSADVKAREESRCLTVHKTDFLRFLGRDFFVGLQFEKISSKRLAHPIFPL